MILGTSPGVAADALLARGAGVAARPSPSAVSPPGGAVRGFSPLASSPSESGSAFGGTPGSHSHGSHGSRRYRLAERRVATPVLAPTVTGFDLGATNGAGAAAGASSASHAESSLRSRGSSVKGSALRLGSPGSCANAAAPETHGASPGGLSRGLSAMRDELETTTPPKPPLHPASPTKTSSRGDSHALLELADDTVEYYAARLEPLPPLTVSERSDLDALRAAYPESFDAREGVFDAFALAATRLNRLDSHEAVGSGARVGSYKRALETARVLAGLGMRSDVIAAALLHGAMDAGVVDASEARARCGSEAQRMASDASRLSLFSDLARASADEAPLSEEDKRRFRSMLIAMTDARVVVLKLAERVVDMEDDALFDERSGASSDEARRRLAEETLATYVPLASRLGVWSLKARLEDACFLRLKPDEHAALAAELERDGRRAAVAEAVNDVAAALDAAAVGAERVYGRPKSLYGVYRKMTEKELENISDVHDVRAVRVIVPTEKACYEALNAVLSLPGYHSVPARVKDYVARAKTNGYRSLHAVVVDESGRACEVQIRTPEMHAAAEFGLASHWRYKEGDETSGASHKNARRSIDEQVRWARFALSWQGRLAHDEAAAARRAEMFVDAADAADEREPGALCEIVPCPCPFPTHRPECANHEDNLRLGVGGAHGDARARGLVSADSASFAAARDDDDTSDAERVGGDVVTVVAVVDGRMRVVDVPRGARLSDVDLAGLGGGPGDARAAEFSSVVSVAVNREPVPPGAEVAVTLRMGDLVEVSRARVRSVRGGSPDAELSSFLSDELVTANNVVSAKGFFP
uniref:RelA/SpoT domain-containing protein n=1 Tax=Micromonas pusilla TaxID=38833 RepID=A0A7S0GNZ6_MICPS|mmetsp:Transcript_1438/g.5995  ORF Transcript_1438/g.5995 Transcript_1438/m.5995 type:complete len:818 (+) Transcript_1438:112-2565(+)